MKKQPLALLACATALATSPAMSFGQGLHSHLARFMAFVIPVPEGGAAGLYLLLAGAVCLGAVVIGSRKGFGSRA